MGAPSGTRANVDKGDLSIGVGVARVARIGALPDGCTDNRQIIDVNRAGSIDVTGARPARARGSGIRSSRDHEGTREDDGHGDRQIVLRAKCHR
jgi:hypothetical protein